MAQCAVCGVVSPDQFRFCGGCGARLAPAEARPREVRKTVSVLFADVAGSTQLGERQDPEATRAIMTRYFGAMRAIIEQHGGTVEKFIGDAVMSVFGTPVLHEDDALRAVRAAVEIQATLQRLNAELEAERGVSVRMRIGVNTGEVVAGDVSTGQTFVTGDTVNTAARLEAAAAPGETLIGAVTWRLVRDAVSTEPVEPLALKGKAEPVPAWRVVAVEGRDAPGRRLDTVLVGRDEELRRLRATFSTTAAGDEGRLVTVVGPAGIGKSRLAAELGRSATADGGRMLRGRCLPYGEGATFWPLRELVVGATGAAADDPPEALVARLEAILAGQPDAAWIAHVVGEAIGASIDGIARADLVEGLRRLLEALAARGPLLVIWDDLQWAEPMLLDVIEAACAAIRRPVLTLGVGREDLLDRRPAWAEGAVAVGPLPAIAADELVAGLLEGRHLPPPLQARLASTAEGNPLFLIETVAMLVEDGHLRQTDEGWDFGAGLADVPIPPTVQALVGARLDQLAPGDRELAEVASVIGRSFRDDELADLAELGASVVEVALGGLVASGIVRREPGAGSGATYRFRHLLLRDACYDALAKDRRATLHARYAAAMVAKADGRADGLEAIIGAHLEQAARYRGELGQPAERTRLAADAAPWLERAGRAAVRRHDPDAALSLLGRAVALLPDDDPSRFAATLQLAEARRQAGDLAGARALLAEVADAAGRAALPELTLRARVLSAWLDGTDSVDPRLVDAIMDDETLSLLWGLRLDRAYEAGRLGDAAEAADAVLRHATAAGDPWLVARRARSVLVDVAVVDATPVAEAIALCEATLEGAGHDRRLEAAVLAALGRLEAMGGDPETARRHVADARAASADLGLYPRVFAAEATAAVASIDGDHATAADALRHARSLAIEVGDAALAVRLAVALAAELARAGRDGDSGAMLPSQRDLTTHGAVETVMRYAGIQALLTARVGDAATASSWALGATLTADRSDALLWRAEARAWAGAAMSIVGDPAGPIELAEAGHLYLAKGATRLAAIAAGMISPTSRDVLTAGPQRVELDDPALLALGLSTAGVRSGRPVLLLVGGADGLPEAELARIGALIEEVLPSTARELDAVVVDGGSDAGIMRAAGRAWRSTRCRQPLIGVMARGTIAAHTEGDTRRAGTQTAPPEPNHTHLVVVPGERWGDERPWLLGVAAALSGARPRAMLLVNGGPLARREALEAAADGVPVLALRGSGRVADELADAVDRGEAVVGPGGIDVGDRIRAVDGEVQALRAGLRRALRRTEEPLDG